MSPLSPMISQMTPIGGSRHLTKSTPPPCARALEDAPALARNGKTWPVAPGPRQRRRLAIT